MFDRAVRDSWDSSPRTHHGRRGRSITTVGSDDPNRRPQAGLVKLGVQQTVEVEAEDPLVQLILVVVYVVISPLDHGAAELSRSVTHALDDVGVVVAVRRQQRADAQGWWC